MRGFKGTPETLLDPPLVFLCVLCSLAVVYEELVVFAYCNFVNMYAHWFVSKVGL